MFVVERQLALPDLLLEASLINKGVEVKALQRDVQLWGLGASHSKRLEPTLFTSSPLCSTQAAWPG